MKNTNISEDILRIAKQLIQKEVPLCFDVVKYDRMIREKIESRTGKKYDGPVFISEEMNEAEKARKEQYDIDFSEACRERERLKTKERRKEKEAMDNE